MTCAKAIVRARLLCRNGKFYEGENTCANPQSVCPRKPGDGYMLCVTTCKQPMHAEVAAIMAAMDDGAEVRGGHMRVAHTHVCQECRDMMRDYRITWEITKK